MNADMTNAQHGDPTLAVHIPVGSVSLDGELLVPSAAEGIVLFAHTGGPPGPRLRLLAQLLRKAGLGTLLFELITPLEARADAGHLRFNIGLLTQRLVSVAHWLGEEDEARHQRLGFFGAGTGAGAALVAAADLGKTIGAVVSSGGRPDLAGNALLRLKCPTLLIVGERDDEAVELNEEAYGMLDCEKELRLIRGATHSFEETGALEEVARLTAEWFLEHLHLSSGARFRH